MEDGAAAGPAADEEHTIIFIIGADPVILQGLQVGLQPRVLVAADDDARAVYVQEEDAGVGRGIFKQEMLDGEVHEGVGGERLVDLMAGRAAAGEGGQLAGREGGIATAEDGGDRDRGHRRGQEAKGRRRTHLVVNEVEDEEVHRR